MYLIESLMLFSSNIFLTIFLPLVLVIYYVTPGKWRNSFLLFASVMFYSWGGVTFLPVLFASLILDFLLVRQFRNKEYRRFAFIAAILNNILLLGFFKYSGFFLENVELLVNQLGLNASLAINVILPIGISFFTFQKISYVVDVYRSKATDFNNFLDYALYIIMFPQLIAGPIVRFTDIYSQITSSDKKIGVDQKLTGFYRFTLGLAKKVLIADVLAITIDQAFTLGFNELNSVTTWLIVLAYALQIYFDFSGYSDMAIGIGNMLGYKFPENFNFPYIASSVTEFWKRWHITLTTWFREYVYIPLGGNRKGSGRTYLNLFLVFLLSGLWHGAAWNFVLWGVLHGTALIVERAGIKKALDIVPKFFSIFYTLLFVNLTWVVFRAESFQQIIEVTRKMILFDFTDLSVDLPLRFIIVLIIGWVISFSPLIVKSLDNSSKKWQEMILTNRKALIYTGLSLFLFIICLTFVHAIDSSPFIYFRF